MMMRMLHKPPQPPKTSAPTTSSSSLSFSQKICRLFVTIPATLSVYTAAVSLFASETFDHRLLSTSNSGGPPTTLCRAAEQHDSSMMCRRPPHRALDPFVWAVQAMTMNLGPLAATALQGEEDDDDYYHWYGSILRQESRHRRRRNRTLSINQLVYFLDLNDDTNASSSSFNSNGAVCGGVMVDGKGEEEDDDETNTSSGVDDVTNEVVENEQEQLQQQAGDITYLLRQQVNAYHAFKQTSDYQKKKTARILIIVDGGGSASSTEIPPQSCKDFPNLQHIVIGPISSSSITEIGSSFLMSCPSLVEPVDLSHLTKLKRIGSEFLANSTIKSDSKSISWPCYDEDRFPIILPPHTITEIGTHFMSRLSVSGGAPVLDLSTTLVKSIFAPGAHTKLSELILPDSVIETIAVRDLPNLVSLQLPQKQRPKRIVSGFLSGCRRLKLLSVPEGWMDRIPPPEPRDARTGVHNRPQKLTGNAQKRTCSAIGGGARGPPTSSSCAAPSLYFLFKTAFNDIVQVPPSVRFALPSGAKFQDVTKFLKALETVA